MTKTQPTHKKLPALVVCGLRIDHLGADMDSHYACIPGTAAQARQLVKAAEFLRLPEEEKVEAIAKASDAYFDSINGNHEAFKASEHARSVLAAMGMGGAK